MHPRAPAREAVLLCTGLYFTPAPVHHRTQPIWGKVPITRGPCFARGLTIRNGFAYIGLPHVHRPQRTRNHQVRHTRGLSGRTGKAVRLERRSRG
jgi:hypothetical protein